MNATIETNLEKLWQSLNFDLAKEIPTLHYQYKHLGFDYPEIFTTLKNHLRLLVQNTFYQFMIARFGHLYPFYNEQLLEKSDKVIKQQYNRLFVSLEYGQKEKMNTVLVIIAVIVGRIVEKIFPNVIYNQRLTIQLMHCLIICTLGIMVGDNSVKYMIGKQIGARQLTRFLFREMFEKKILIAKIKEIQQQKQWPELKKLFYNPPPPPQEKKPFDQEQVFQKPEQGFVRGLDSYHVKSIQMSRAFMNDNKAFKLKESTLKKYACKMNVSLECNSPYYKPYKKRQQEVLINVLNQQKKEVINNKKNLKYWQRYINNFKNKSSIMGKQKFPNITSHEDHRVELESSQFPEINNNRYEQNSILQKSNPKHYTRNRNSKHTLSLHQKTEQTKLVNPLQKPQRITKHRSPGRTIVLKNQSKIFYENKLQMEDEYGQSLTKQFCKINMIR